MINIKNLSDRELLEGIYEMLIYNMAMTKNIQQEINMEDKDFVQNIVANIIGDIFSTKSGITK